MDVSNCDTEEGVAKGSGLASAVAPPARAGRWETASRRAGRVGLFPLVLSGAFYTCVGGQGGPDCACADDGAPPCMTWLSPQQVLARCLAPDIEALTSAPAFQQGYWSNQHAALVPRGVGRQQCPHPCFLPAATGADSAIFCGLSDARATRRPGSAACSTGNVIRVIEEWLSRAPPPQRLAQLQRETTPARAGRGLRAEIHA